MKRAKRWIRGMSLSVLDLTLASSSAQPTVAAPTPALLRSYGLNVSLLPPSHVPISIRQAKNQVFRNFSQLPPTTPMVAELLMFSNSHGPFLSKPQPAWLMTWREKTSLQTPFVPPTQHVPTYTHMNEIISATTGQMLLAFPSP
ncbi:hypothetical protein [Sulfobacillus thermosulfidooxidans]|uniref:hypothetical protein n=1 Tax=Sulfobacillus thermosulfidooxidans TaxID=28034 RepID=UPI0006B58400|nr:hypothetical protein [Sulfobacillus thermosulfidooxidans]